MRKVLLYFLFLLPLFLNAQTRYYLNLNNNSPLSPAFNAGWAVTTGAARFDMYTTKDGSTIASKTSGQIGGVAVRKALIDQWISPELATQTVTGTFTGQVRMNLNSVTSTTGQGFLYLRVVNRDGSIATEVGTCTTTDLTTTLTNRTLISLSVGTLSIQAGQRFCIDLGWNMSVGTTTTRTGTASRGSSSGTDLPANNTATAVNTPWVEFSQTLVEYDGSKNNFFASAYRGANIPISYAVYNPSDKSTNITLSGGNLVAQSTSAATDYQVRTTLSKSSGKWYWENTFVRGTPSDPFFVIGGLSKRTETVNAYTGFTNGCCITTDGQVWVNGVGTPTFTAWTDGQVAGFAWDAGAGTLQVYRNNSLLGTVASGMSGTYFIGTGTFQTLGTTTTNFGASALTYTPPSGFNAGVYK